MPKVVARPLLLEELPEDLSDQDRLALFEHLSKAQEIAGLEVEQLALVRQGANMRPFHARKSREIRKMVNAIPAAVAERATTTLQAARDNIDAVLKMITDNTEGTDGAPEEVADGLPENIVNAIQSEVSALNGMLETEHAGETVTEGGEGEGGEPPVPPKAEGGEGGEGGEKDPDKVEKQDGASSLADLTAERAKLVTDELASIMAGIADGTLTKEQSKAKFSAIYSQMWTLSDDATALAKNAVEKSIEAQRDASEALTAGADLKKQVEAQGSAIMKLLDIVEKAGLVKPPKASE